MAYITQGLLQHHRNTDHVMHTTRTRDAHMYTSTTMHTYASFPNMHKSRLRTCKLKSCAAKS